MSWQNTKTEVIFIIQKTIKLILNSNLWFGGSLVAYSKFVCEFINFSWSYKVGLLVLFIVCFGYSFDKIADLKFQKFIIPEKKTQFGWIIFSFFLMIFSAIALVAVLIDAPFLAQIITIICVILGAFYAVPLFPFYMNNQIKLIKLKEIPGFKSFFVAGVITSGLIGFVLAYSSYQGSTEELFTIVMITFLLMFTGTVIYDLPDTEADKKSGILTIPVMIGISKTKLLLYILNAFALFILIFIEGKVNFGLLKITPIIITLIATLIHINISGKSTTNIYFYEYNCTLFYLPLIISIILNKL